jgi:hypothetical protein
MSWHTSGLLIRADWHTRPAALSHQLGFPEPELEGRVSFEEATSLGSPGWAIGYVGGWTAVWDAHMFLNLTNPQPPAPQSLWPAKVEAGLARLSERSQVFSLLLEGASGTFGFALYRDGSRVRCYLRQADTIWISLGTTLPEEVEVSASSRDEETRILLLLQRLTVPISQLAGIEYDVYRFR